jgi:hypothetical protein
MAAGKNESTAVQKNGLAVNSHFSVVQVRQTPRGRWFCWMALILWVPAYHGVDHNSEPRAWWRGV